jgi:FlaG/FlaF family flagellin (archaellin)
MRLSIAAEILLGALVVIIAAHLASLTSGTHEQPVWPTLAAEHCGVR